MLLYMIVILGGVFFSAWNILNMSARIILMQDLKEKISRKRTIVKNNEQILPKLLHSISKMI